MFVFWMMLAWCATPWDADWAINGTELFQPLQPGEVIVTPGGDVLVLNFNSAVITRFDQTGKKANNIGFKGRGPGGLTYPMNFFLHDEKVYVHDLIDNTINAFHLDGSFIAKTHGPKPGSDLAKIPGGWILGNWAGRGDISPDPGVYWVDDAFENKKELFKLKSLGEKGGLSMEISDGKTLATYNPISTAPTMAYSQNLDRVYIAEPEGFQIHVIDSASGTLIRTISKKSQPVPFDDAWGDAGLEQVKEMLKARGHAMDVKKNYPDYFPIIRGMNVLPNGTLVVNRWRGNPDENDWLIAFDEEGKEVSIDWGWEEIQRVAGQHKSWWLVTTLVEEEAGLGRCKPENLKAFAKENPIDFDGPIGRQIRLEN